MDILLGAVTRLFTKLNLYLRTETTDSDYRVACRATSGEFWG